MDVHKPKPWHGVREFLKEYLIIVIGVLTALGAEQTVEWLHTQKELTEARAALREEVTQDIGHLRYAQQEDRCFLAGMARYAAWAKGGPKPPPINQAVKFPSFAHAVWDEVKGGAVAHMPLKERLAYAQFYGNGENQLLLIANDRNIAGTISRIAVLDKLDPQDAKALLQDSTAPQTFLKIKIAQDGVMLDQAKALGGRVEPFSAKVQGYLDTLCGMTGAPTAD